MEILKGIGVSPGVVIGPAFVLDEQLRHVPRRSVPESDVQHQLERLEDAVEQSVDELDQLREQIAQEFDADAAKILEFHITLLRDPHFLDPIREIIRSEQVTSEYAVSTEIGKIAGKFLAMDSEAMKSKVSDLYDLDRRLLRHLIGETLDRLAHLQGDAIVIAHDLTPSQTANLDTDHVRAFATDAGGRTSHTAIMARALGIPAVVGVARAVQDVIDGDRLIVDGDRGVLIIDPDEETLDEYRQRIRERQAYELTLTELADLPPVTLDGVHIKLCGNIEFPYEIEVVRENGGEGVGLYRTEFLYLASDHEPSEEDHYEAYSRAVKLCDGQMLTIRTLDLGSDKYTQSRAVIPERNPALGCRSIRYCLQHLPMFKRQLRAILRASAEGPLRIMFPLVTNPMELRQARMVLNDVMEDLEDESIAFDPSVQVGIMIEAPSAALMGPVFAREVDFFSIGTNDLIQYTLAVDRTNERVANLYSGAHPAVLRLITEVVKAGRREGIDISLCGEMAGEVEYAMLLVGMGLRSLSLVPTAIPDIKRVVRSIDTKQCEQLVRKVESFDSERRILQFLREETRKILPEGFDGRSVD
ncbi:MAG: phosphoenolpyruvate--protein phosphotransferase [Phycisphaerales bacterium]